MLVWIVGLLRRGPALRAQVLLPLARGRRHRRAGLAARRAPEDRARGDARVALRRTPAFRKVTENTSKANRLRMVGLKRPETNLGSKCMLKNQIWNPWTIQTARRGKATSSVASKISQETLRNREKYMILQ